MRTKSISPDQIIYGLKNCGQGIIDNSKEKGVYFQWRNIEKYPHDSKQIVEEALHVLSKNKVSLPWI